MMLRPRIFLLILVVGLAGPAHSLQAVDPALEAYYSANSLYNKRLYDLAAEEYRSFLARFPRHEKAPSAKLGLALSHYEREQFAQAEPILADLAGRRDSPHPRQVHNLWGQCLLVAGRPAEAEEAFRWSVAHGKERFYMELPGVAERVEESPEISVATVTDLEPMERSLAGLTEALFQQRKWQEAVETSRELLDLVPDGRYSTRTRFILSLCLYEGTRYAEAEEALQELLASGADAALLGRARFLLAECLREQGKLEAAASTHARVSKEEAGELAAQALFRLGFVRFQQERYPEAALAFVDLRTLHPQSPHLDQAGLYLGRCRLELEEFEAAQSTFGDLTTRPGVAAEANLWLARTFLAQKRFDEANGIATKALQQYADSPEAPKLRFAQAQALLGLNKLAEAEKSLARLTDSTDPLLQADALRLRAFALHRAGHFEASFEACNEFLETFPSDPTAEEVAFLKAENLFFTKQREEAAGAYRHFIPWQGKGPFTDRARFRIVQIRSQEERWEVALTEARPLLEKAPEGAFFASLAYLAGVAAQQEQRWSEAAELLQAFVDRHAAHELAPEALLRLAHVYEKNRDTTAAKRSLVALRDLYTDSVVRAQGLVELGRLQEESKDPKAARASYEAALAAAPDESLAASARYRLAWLAVRDDRINEAIAQFGRVSEQQANPVLAADALYQSGALLVQAGRPGEAEERLAQYLETQKGGAHEAQAAFSLGMSLTRQNRYERASGVWRRFVESYPSSGDKPRALYEWAWCERELARTEASVDLLQRLLKEHPRHELASRAQLDLAEFAFEAEDFDNCLRRIDQLLASKPPDDVMEPALYRRAWALLQREQHNAAADAFEAVLAQYPLSEHAAVSAYQAGELRLDQKRFERSHEHFATALKAPGAETVRERALLRFGETQTLINQWEQARETFASFLESYPNSAYTRRARLWLGWTQENLKDYEEAIESYRAAQEGGARDEVAARSQFQIGECLYAMGNYNDAIKELVKVDVNYAFPQWSSRALLEIGQILERKQQSDEAQQRFREVIDRYPGTDEAYLAEDLLEDFETGKGIR